MKLVTITGCLGFIGLHVTKKCLEKGWRVYGIDDQTYASNPEILEYFDKFYGDSFTYVKKNICDLKQIPDCDYVINIAAETHVGNSIVDSSNFIKTNIGGVQNILNILKNKPNNVSKRPILFQFSTDEVYGDIVEGEHYETDNLSPSNPYSASKAAADLMIKAWCRTYDLEYVILRPTNNYGCYQYPEKLIPLSVKNLIRNIKIKLHDEGKPIRNWLHVEDTANAVIAIIESGKVNEIYNVAGGFEQENIETVKKIVNSYYNKNIDWKKFIDLGYKRVGQDVRYAINDNKLRSIGWKPKKVFDKELAKIVKFYKDNFKW